MLRPTLLALHATCANLPRWSRKRRPSGPVFLQQPLRRSARASARISASSGVASPEPKYRRRSTGRVFTCRTATIGGARYPAAHQLRRSRPSPFLRLGIETPRPIGKSDEQVTDELARRLVGEAALVVGLVLCLGDHHLRPVECFLHALCAYPDQVAQASLLQFGTEHLADGLGAFHVQGFAEDLLRTSA